MAADPTPADPGLSVDRDPFEGVVEIGWRAASFAPLFPVLAGRIVADGSGLQLHGVYAPPGGGIGLLIDQALLHYFARRTATWFLDRLVEEVVASSRPPGSDR